MASDPVDSGSPRERTLVLVVGSGRSGTSLFSGIAQRLGLYVPQPEVPPDDTNPRGFAESRWVVDFHARLLRAAGVQVADARPAAWALAAEAGLEPRAERTLSAWLREQFARAPGLIIKDPRLSWFLPLWRRCAAELGASPRFVTMVRHPAAVVDSKQRWYGGRVGEIGRAAGWVNQALFTERATRDGLRAFVRYEDLLDDWPSAVARVGAELELAAILDAPAPAIRRAHEFVDVGLSRSRRDWGDLRLPAPLRAQADEIAQLLDGLAGGGATDGTTERLDALRAQYVEYYAEAEAVATSSVLAARAEARPAPHGAVPPAAMNALAMIPARYKRRVPRRVRVAMVRTLARL